MAQFSTGLSALQRDLLAALFAHESSFYLTGGAALVGFHGLLRRTDDLDIFTADRGDFEHVHATAIAAAERVGASCRPLQASTAFRRYLFTRGDEACRVDFVCEPVPQIHDQKERLQGIAVDPLDEIMANKICSLVGRSAARDFWDLWQLATRGLSLENALAGAERKDAGVNRESLVMVLSDIDWTSLRALGEREGLSGWSEIETFFRTFTEKTALDLLPDDSDHKH